MALRQTCFGKSPWGGPLVGSYPNWFIAELRYPETIDGNPCHARFTPHAKIIGALPTTQRRPVHSISDKRAIHSSIGRTCMPTGASSLRPKTTGPTSHAPKGQQRKCTNRPPPLLQTRICLMFPDSGFASFAPTRCFTSMPRISTAITPELNASAICRVEHSAFDYLVISMMKNTPPAIAQARIAQAKRAKLRANQREACA